MASKTRADLDVTQNDKLTKRLAQKAELRRTRRSERFVDDLIAVTKTVQGRRVLWHLMAESRIHRDPFVSGDPYATHVNIGDARAGNRISLALTRHLPEIYSQMSREYVAEIKQEKAEDQALLEEVARNG